MSKQHDPLEYTMDDKERWYSGDKHPCGDERSPFERDRSRIIHSGAFRRLQGKTQVFTPGEGDFFRTRMTHSLEVAQISKGLALRLGANADLVEAVCLVHDIGHPPFGHAGEDELKKLMKPYGGFEANAQNLRIFTQLEAKSREYPGLNLTRAVIDGQMKYKESFRKGKEKFIYREHLRLMKWASEDAGKVVGVRATKCKSFECEIMDWADVVAYAVHDLEDSLHAGYINLQNFCGDSTEISQIVSCVARDPEFRSVNVGQIYEDLQRVLVDCEPEPDSHAAATSHQMRKATRKDLTSLLIKRYIRAAKRVPRRTPPPYPVSPRYLYSVEVDLKHRVEVALLNKINRTFVIDSPQVAAFEEKGKHILRSLFLKLMEKNNAKRLLPDDWKEYLARGNAEPARARVVCDYISGMTDGYAQRTYGRLFLPHQGSIYEVL